MNGPGYHFYIRKNGDIKTTRPIEKIGAHARGHNAQSIGICYEGGISERGRLADTRTVWQKHSLRVLVREMCIRDSHWHMFLLFVEQWHVANFEQMTELSFVKKLVLNLTLAGSQSDFVRNHVNIIPAPVKELVVCSCRSCL